ncbi:MAG: hypothetical protein AB1481_02995 [Candidatus Omnitrophota bacterium]
MPYENNLDEKVFVKELDTDKGKIIVSVHSYNNGPKKLQITREVKDRQGNVIFAKLGRLSREEVEGVLPFIQAALEIM